MKQKCVEDLNETHSMASFDREEEEDAAKKNAFEATKYPVKRLELSIRKFVKVLDIDLSRLYRHKANITRLTNTEDWHGLHREQINASQTIQQIKANIREIEKVRNQVNDEDLDQFDIRVQDVKDKAIQAMEEFMFFVGVMFTSDSQNLDQSEESQALVGRGDCDISNKSSCSAPQDIPTVSKARQITPALPGVVENNDDSTVPLSYGSLPATLSLKSVPVPTLHVVPQDSEAAVSWEQLQEDIVELNQMVHHFAAEVEQQGETISSIDSNIESAHQNVQEGTQHLAKAAKYKSALLPVIGAVVGGVVAGPIGLAAGLKLGLAGAVGGGAAGFLGGSVVKKHQQKISDVELKNLTDRRTASLSDLPDSVENKIVKSKDEDESSQRQPAMSKPVEDDTAVLSSVTSSFKRFFSFSDDA